MSRHRCEVPHCDGTQLGHHLAVEFPVETAAYDEAMAYLVERIGGEDR